MKNKYELLEEQYKEMRKRSYEFEKKLKEYAKIENKNKAIEVKITTLAKVVDELSKE